MHLAGARYQPPEGTIGTRAGSAWRLRAKSIRCQLPEGTTDESPLPEAGIEAPAPKAVDRRVLGQAENCTDKKRYDNGIRIRNRIGHLTFSRAGKVTIAALF